MMTIWEMLEQYRGARANIRAIDESFKILAVIYQPCEKAHQIQNMMLLQRERCCRIVGYVDRWISTVTDQEMKRTTELYFIQGSPKSWDRTAWLINRAYTGFYLRKKVLAFLSREERKRQKHEN